MKDDAWECKECHYWEAIHGIGGFDYHDEKFAKCNKCTKPFRSGYREFVEKRGQDKD